MKRLAVAATLALATLATWASPCTAPAEYVRASASAERQPLVRPYVLQGLAVIALRQVANQPWLELAVDSEATARKAVAGAQLKTVDGVVLLACGAPLSVVQAPRPQGASPLW